MQDLTVTLIQSGIVSEDPAANRTHFAQKIDAVKNATDLIILPELFTTGFPVDPHKHAEEIDGDSMQFLLQKAAEKNCAMACSMILKHEQNFTNEFLWVNPDGTFETYSKRHVFHLGEESEFITPGRNKLILQYKDWRISPMVCYDLRFPVWSKNKYRDGRFDYDLLIYVANWPEVRSRPWKQLLVARAIENQSYVIGLNRIGTDKNGDNYSGDSMVIDPEGNLLLQGEENKECTKTLSLSASAMNEYRKQFNVGPDWDDFEIRI